MNRLFKKMAAVLTLFLALPTLVNAQQFEDKYYKYEVIDANYVRIIGFSTQFDVSDDAFIDSEGNVRLTHWAKPYIDTESYDGTFRSVKEIGELAFSPDNPLYTSWPGGKELCQKLVGVETHWSGITKIGDKAFMNCSSLSYISLGNNTYPHIPMDYIGAHAFDGTALTRVYWTGDAKIIQPYCFANIPTLTEFEFSSSTTTIGEGAFQNAGFKMLEFPSSLKNIESKAFDGCSDLQGIKCNDDNPNDIAADAFEGIPSDVALVVPKGTEDLYKACVGWNVFGDRIQSFSMVGKTVSNEYFTFEIYEDDTETEAGKCVITGLSPECETNVLFDWQIGSCGVSVLDAAGARHYYSATSIANRAFRNSNINRIELNQSSISWIGEQAFAKCTSLTYIALPETLQDIDEKAFEGCTNLTFINLPDAVSILGKRAFAATGLKNICYTPSIDTFDDEVFAECPNLTDVVIPEHIIYLGEGVFSESGIQSVVLPSMMNNNIGAFAFADCPNLTKVIAQSFDPGDINTNVFKGVAEGALLFVPVGASSNYMGYPGWTTYLQLCELIDRSGTLFEDGDYKYYVYSFNGVDSDYRNVGLMGVAKGKNPTEVVVPDKVIYDGMDYNVLYVGEEAFQNNGNITRADFTACEKLNAISSYAFSGCANLKEVTFPESLEEILEGAFKQSGVEEIHIPQHVFDIGDYAFRDCVGLKTLGLSMYPSCDIGEEAFMNTTALENLNLPYSTMLTIFDRAFSNSGIKKLDIPYCIDTDLWGEQVFKDCPNLKNVCSHISDIYPPKALPYDNIFEGVADKATLWVPEGFVDTYKALDGWKDFSEIKEDLPIPTGIEDVNQETLTNNRYYDMQGRLVENPTKGLYITNGRKVIVK